MLFALIVTGTILLWLLLLSITFIPSGSIGAVMQFKKFVRVMEPGLGFIIPLVEQVDKYSTQTHQDELPDEPEFIDRVNDVAAPGKKLPFRVPHVGMNEAIFYVKKSSDPDLNLSDPNSYEIKRFKDLIANDPELKGAMEKESLHVPLTSEVAVVVEWDLPGKHEPLKNFIENIEPEEGRTREEEVAKRIEDMASRVLQEQMSLVTLGHARERMPLFSRMLRTRLEQLVGETATPGEMTPKPWGIHIRDAYTKSIHPGHTVNTARSEAGAAVSKKESGLRDAELKAESTRMQADADRHAEEQKGKGEAERITAMAAAMKDPSAKFLAQLDVASEVLPKAKVVVMPSDLGVIGGVLSLAEEFKNQK